MFFIFQYFPLKGKKLYLNSKLEFFAISSANKPAQLKIWPASKLFSFFKIWLFSIFKTFELYLISTLSLTRSSIKDFETSLGSATDVNGICSA